MGPERSGRASTLAGRAPSPQARFGTDPADPYGACRPASACRLRPSPRAHLPAAPRPLDAAPSGAGQRLGGGSWGRGPGAPPLPYLRAGGGGGAGPAGRAEGRGLVAGRRGRSSGPCGTLQLAAAEPGTCEGR